MLYLRGHTLTGWMCALLQRLEESLRGLQEKRRFTKSRMSACCGSRP